MSKSEKNHGRIKKGTKATPLSKDKSPVGSKVNGKAVGALSVRKVAIVHMDVEKICKHKLSSGRVMHRLAGVSTDKAHNRLSKIVSKEDAAVASKALGIKIAECRTAKRKVVKPKVEGEKKKKVKKPKVEGEKKKKKVKAAKKPKVEGEKPKKMKKKTTKKPKVEGEKPKKKTVKK